MTNSPKSTKSASEKIQSLFQKSEFCLQLGTMVRTVTFWHGGTYLPLQCLVENIYSCKCHCCLLKVSSCCQGGGLSHTALAAHVVHMVGDVIVPSDSLSSATDRSKDSDCCSQNWHRRKYLAAVINSAHFKLQVQLCRHTATGWG